MKLIKAFLFVIIVSIHTILLAQNSIPYGDNKDAGKYIQLNGIKHYYEIYGEGNPLILIHGNGTGISGWAAQIAYFSKSYKVYAIDNRGRGKSELGKDSLSYIQLTKDIAEFIKVLNLQNVNIIGKSDGGIIGIMLGIYYPTNIQKIVAFGANMWPDSTALYASVVDDIKSSRLKAEWMIQAKDTTQNWKLIYQRFRMMEFQPNITKEDLQKINIPVMVMTCDRDLIKEEHSFFIYKNITNSSLCIIPGETHHLARQNPDMFNKMADKFLSKPFRNNNFRYSN